MRTSRAIQPHTGQSWGCGDRECLPDQRPVLSLKAEWGEVEQPEAPGVEMGVV